MQAYKTLQKAAGEGWHGSCSRLTRTQISLLISRYLLISASLSHFSHLSMEERKKERSECVLPFLFTSLHYHSLVLCSFFTQQSHGLAPVVSNGWLGCCDWWVELELDAWVFCLHLQVLCCSLCSLYFALFQWNGVKRNEARKEQRKEKQRTQHPEDRKCSVCSFFSL